MYRVPAVSRMLADPNLQKLITCPCWKNGRVQLKILYRKKQKKIRQNRPCPKNWDFHRNSLHIRVPILGHPVYKLSY